MAQLLRDAEHALEESAPTQSAKAIENAVLDSDPRAAAPVDEKAMHHTTELATPPSASRQASTAGQRSSGDVEKHMNNKGTTKVDADPNVVRFNGPDDPEKAVNWSPRRKWSAILVTRRRMLD